MGADIQVMKWLRILLMAVFVKAIAQDPFGLVQQTPDSASAVSLGEKHQGPLIDMLLVDSNAVSRQIYLNIQADFADSLIQDALTIRSGNLRDVLQGIALQHKLNLLLDPDVQGSVTLQLRKIKVRDLLELLGKQFGLVYLMDAGVLRVSVYKPPSPKAPPPPPSPPFQVTWESSKLGLQIGGWPLDTVARAVSQATGRNVIAGPGSTILVRSFLQPTEFDKALRLMAETNGLKVDQREGAVLLSVKPVLQLGEAGSKPGGGSNEARVFLSEDSSIVVEALDAGISGVLSALTSTGLALTVYGTPERKISMHTRNRDPGVILEQLLAGTDFGWWRDTTSWFVGPLSMQEANATDLVVLQHVRAEDALASLPQTTLGSAQTKVVKSHNAILVLGSSRVRKEIRQVLEKLDYPVPQILIEALVVDVDMDRVRDFGANLFLGGSGAGAAKRSVFPGMDVKVGKDDAQWFVDQLPGIRDVLTLPPDFLARIQALESEKKLKVRSKPQISTLNGSEATITVGQTQYFLLNTETNYAATSATDTRTTTQRFEKIEANVTLTVTPYVTGKNEVTCDIVPDFAEPEGSFNADSPPTINRRFLRSKVRLREGETIVLGGLVKESNNHVKSGIPFLSTIPFLGNLFSNHRTETSRSQLLIFVTPHIYYGEDANVDVDAWVKKQSDLAK